MVIEFVVDIVIGVVDVVVATLLIVTDPIILACGQ